MKILYLTFAVIVFSAGLSLAAKSEKVDFIDKPQEKKVDVYVGGEYFTSYIYPDDMEKQTLYPIVSASGKIITRGYPLHPRPFERTDHPHHVGL